MVSGCDIWLNNPRRPLEASGTSGMKTTAHGCLNMSILDGWWREGYDGTNGFAIGGDAHPENVEEQDRVDSENLYKVLSSEVFPVFMTGTRTGFPGLGLAKSAAQWQPWPSSTTPPGWCVNTPRNFTCLNDCPGRNCYRRPRDLRSLNDAEVGEVLVGWGHKSYRTRQLLDWVYKKGCAPSTR